MSRRERRQEKRKRGGERATKGEEEGERVRGKRRSGPVWGLGPGVTVGCRPPRGKHLNISLRLPRLSRKLCWQTNYIWNYVPPSLLTVLGNFSCASKMLVPDTFFELPSPCWWCQSWLARCWSVVGSNELDLMIFCPATLVVDDNNLTC